MVCMAITFCRGIFKPSSTSPSSSQTQDTACGFIWTEIATVFQYFPLKTRCTMEYSSCDSNSNSIWVGLSISGCSSYTHFYHYSHGARARGGRLKQLRDSHHVRLWNAQNTGTHHSGVLVTIQVHSRPCCTGHHGGWVEPNAHNIKGQRSRRFAARATVR